MRLIPVVLCGGSGTRLWPLSRSYLPKQFLPLVSERTMLQETLARLQGLEGLEAPIAIANEEHRFLAAEQLREIACAPQAIILEPEGRGTAPAVAAAALSAGAKPAEILLLVLSADHAIGDLPQFHAAIRSAAALAAQGRLAVFGVPPTHPHTGYGYIRRGKSCGDQAYVVERFVEKPSLEKAQGFLAEGGYFWNSGMFLFRADRYLAELEGARPEIVGAVRRALAGAQRDMDFVRLERKAFLASPADSIDYAVMERTRDAVVVQADFAWSDVGSWGELWNTGMKDSHGNVLHGDVIAPGSRNCYVRSEGRLVAAVGASDMVIVETSDAVLVATRERAQEIKQMVEQMKLAQRPEHATHRRVYRPWGYYESIDAGKRFQVKRLMIKAGAKISLQRHQKRAEHWVVVSGTARVTNNEEVIELRENQSTYIPLGARHRLENAGSDPLFVIEVQSGDYLGEDDIERFADDYRRT
jgi:mannose-1-phosphate guanylyltransferase/mannose-6-phosphate isomerase